MMGSKFPVPEIQVPTLQPGPTLWADLSKANSFRPAVLTHFCAVSKVCFPKHIRFSWYVFTLTGNSEFKGKLASLNILYISCRVDSLFNKFKFLLSNCFRPPPRNLSKTAHDLGPLVKKPSSSAFTTCLGMSWKWEFITPFFLRSFMFKCLGTVRPAVLLGTAAPCLTSSQKWDFFGDEDAYPL